MNFGFNSNVHAHGNVYHVQTEDRGAAHPYLDTVVYETGRVVFKRSTSYEAFAATFSKNADFADRLHERLAEQHREVIVELEAGTLELSGKAKLPAQSSAVAPPVTKNEGLDVRLRNPKTWLASGGAAPEVTLDVEVRRRNSAEPLADAEVEALLEHEKERVHCHVAQTDAAGCAILKFSMPATVVDGTSLVIRATDGSVFGELRFRLKANHPAQAPVPILK